MQTTVVDSSEAHHDAPSIPKGNTDALCAKNTFGFLSNNLATLVVQLEEARNGSNTPECFTETIERLEELLVVFGTRYVVDKLEECLVHQEAVELLDTLKGAIPLITMHRDLTPAFLGTLSSLVQHAKWWKHGVLMGPLSDLLRLSHLGFGKVEGNA
jgi:hypothetical protein